ncbi:sigma-70 family RNA polymerase sigma factor [Rosistilla carotiformis]|uniref:sigma-70 family RNA polymerase sigma factor n=1 Tax=Rosistilla carotiformis TaxID=2528017 RepID=UPI001E3DDDEC|nr:sigma-70 family RNA polymerase sigma factor [Rosistilla carotiformis]
MLTLYRPLIQKLVATYPDLKDQADDIAQDVSLVLMRELPVFQRQRKGSFRAWLRIVIVNRLRTAVREHRRGPQALGQASDIGQRIEEFADPNSVAASQWDLEHDRLVMLHILEIISHEFEAKTWLAFQRYALNNEPLAKVAVDLALSPNAIMLAKSRILRRARLEARGIIDEFT